MLSSETRKLPVNDVFSDVLSVVRVQGEISTLLSLQGAASWTGDAGGIHMYLIHTGTMWLHEIEGRQPTVINEGDLLLLVDAPRHVLSTSPSLSGVTPITFVMTQQAHAGWLAVGQRDSVETARLLVGRMRFDDSTGESLVRALPRVLHVARRQDQHQVLGWLDATAHFL